MAEKVIPFKPLSSDDTAPLVFGGVGAIEVPELEPTNHLRWSAGTLEQLWTALGNFQEWRAVSIKQLDEPPESPNRPIV